MRKKIRLHKKGHFPAGWIFLAGFLAGVLLPNIMWKMELYQKTAASVYLIGVFSDSSVNSRDYLLQVLRMRGSLYLLAVFCGISVFGVPLAVAGLFITGVQTGMLLAMSVLQFGLQGGLIGAGLLFPQYLVYLPCLFYLMSQVYVQSLEIWHNKGIFPRGVSEYVLRISLCGAVYVLGILLEVFCNPMVVEILLRSLKIF